MRFKLLVVLAAIVAISAFGINANAQPADGINFSITAAGDTAYSMRDKDFMLATGGTKADTDLSYFGLDNGSGFLATGKKGAVSLFWLFNPVNNSTTMLHGTYSDPSGFSINFGKIATPFFNPNKNNSLNWDIMQTYASFEIFPFQVDFKFKGAYLALIDNTHGYGPMSQASNFTGYTAAQIDTMLPKIAVGYNYGSDREPLWLGVSFVYNTFKLDKPADALDGKSVSAYRLIGNYSQNAIAGILDTIAQVYYGVNTAQLGILGATTSAAFADGTTIKNTKTMGGHGGVAIHVGPHKASAGVGYETSKKDATGAKADTDMTYFVNFKYALDANFSIMPAVSIHDKMKDGSTPQVKQGKETVVGVRWEAIY
jgi:hypothetical protein